MAVTARQGSNGEGIQHFGAVRMRLVGTGNLLMTFYSLSNVKSQTLVPFTMANPTDIEPTRLSNFKTQRASLQFGTTEINEYLKINRIILFTKPIWSGYPG